jgi:hypothetical protein
MTVLSVPLVTFYLSRSFVCDKCHFIVTPFFVLLNLCWCLSKSMLELLFLLCWFLYSLEYDFTLCRAVAQAVSRWLPTVAARVRVQAGMWGLWWTKRHWGRFSPSTSVSLAKHSTDFSIIIITQGWHNRPLVAAVPSGPWIPPPTIQIKNNNDFTLRNWTTKTQSCYLLSRVKFSILKVCIYDYYMYTVVFWCGQSRNFNLYSYLKISIALLFCSTVSHNISLCKTLPTSNKCKLYC